MTDAEIEHLILRYLSSGPKSLKELFGILGATWTAEQIDNALASLQDGKKVEYMPAVGLYKRGAH